MAAGSQHFVHGYITQIPSFSSDVWTTISHDSSETLALRTSPCVKVVSSASMHRVKLHNGLTRPAGTRARLPCQHDAMKCTIFCGRRLYCMVAAYKHDQSVGSDAITARPAIVSMTQRHTTLRRTTQSCKVAVMQRHQKHNTDARHRLQIVLSWRASILSQVVRDRGSHSGNTPVDVHRRCELLSPCDPPPHQLEGAMPQLIAKWSTCAHVTRKQASRRAVAPEQQLRAGNGLCTCAGFPNLHSFRSSIVSTRSLPSAALPE